MWLVGILVVAALLLAGLIVWLLSNELKVKRTADDYAGGSDHYRDRAADVSFDRERLGA